MRTVTELLSRPTSHMSCAPLRSLDLGSSLDDISTKRTISYSIYRCIQDLRYESISQTSLDHHFKSSDLFTICLQILQSRTPGHTSAYLAYLRHLQIPSLYLDHASQQAPTWSSSFLAPGNRIHRSSSGDARCTHSNPKPLSSCSLEASKLSF